MLRTVSASDVQAKVDEQKRLALVGTVHVFVDRQAAPQVEQATRRYSELCENPAQFAVHTLTPNANAAIADIAAACPRVLLIAVFSTAATAGADWIRLAFLQHAAKLPFADVFVADVAAASDSDRQYWESLGVFKLPTILTFKHGHLIDSFAPELAKTLPLQQLAERDAKIRADMEKKKLVPIDIDDVLRRGSDVGKDDWIRRKQEADRKAAEKERREKDAEARRVKARIEEQRKARMGK